MLNVSCLAYDRHGDRDRWTMRALAPPDLQGMNRTPNEMMKPTSPRSAYYHASHTARLTLCPVERTRSLPTARSSSLFSTLNLSTSPAHPACRLWNAAYSASSASSRERRSVLCCCAEERIVCGVTVDGKAFPLLEERGGWRIMVCEDIRYAQQSWTRPRDRRGMWLGFAGK